MMHYVSIHQPSKSIARSLRMLRAVFGRRLRDFLHFNAILDIHEKQVHLTDVCKHKLQRFSQGIPK